MLKKTSVVREIKVIQRDWRGVEVEREREGERERDRQTDRELELQNFILQGL